MRHLASDELLLDYASGALGEAGSLIVATQCALAPEARERVAELEALGGVLLDEIEPEAVSDTAFEALMARLDEGACAPIVTKAPARPAAPSRVPMPLKGYVGEDFDALDWRSVGGGVATHEIELVDDGMRAFLIRVPAGTMIPKHTHKGQEFVLVLEGGLSDEHGHFGRGDMEISDGTIDHQPIADAGADCICLAVTDAPVRLSGPVGRVLNLFVRI